MSSHLKELADYTNNPVIHDQDLFFTSSNQNPTMESEFKYQNIYYPSDDLDFNFLNTPFDHISDNPVNDQSKTMFQFQTSPDGENLTNQSPTTSREADSFISSSSNNVEDLDSSDPMFTFISQMLLEEKMEDEPHMFYDPLALKATEESLYDVLGQQYPGDTVTNSVSSGTFSADDISNFLNSPAGFDGFDPNSLLGETETNSHVALVDQNQGSEGLSDSSVSEMINSMFSNQESMLQFRRGLEEASKFLPNAAQLVTGLDDNRLGIGSEKDVVSVRMVENGDKGRKNHKRDDSDVEDGRTNKQSAIYVDETQESELSEMFDKVLLWPVPKGKGLMCCENPESGSTRTPQLDEGSNSGKGRAKRQGKQGKKNETPDLRTLLILCAQAVSSGDSRTANELLKQIRQHSSPSGDGTQRMAHYFANGLEARLAGSGTGLQNIFGLMTSRRAITAADMLKAYKTHLHACPFKKLSVGFANGTILKVAENASTLHIIDFGVLYGFQWPSLIQHLSLREGGPSKLRITGIELPQQGFRPTERIKETGRRLARYCERFGVPFEYNPIAVQNWETIKLEDLKINKNEVVAVNTLCRFKHLLDDTIEEDCPRDAVLNLIRKTNPNIFVHTIINGSYNAPFFLTRFKEAVYHFSSMFDKFDAVLTREDEERLRFEREFYGREIMNVVACEGAERVERPETYRQWQVRTMRAGFKQLPLDQELMQKLKHKMKTWYHKDFVIDEDSNWMLQGWKGRITYASSCWVPA